MSSIDRRSYTPHLFWKGKHAFQHWYRDNQICFITARCRDRLPAFATEQIHAELGQMTQRIHGSGAKLLNDLLEQNGNPRYVRFWRDKRHNDYFDRSSR